MFSGPPSATWLDLLVLALAVWRLSYMFVSEDGPFWVFGRIRKAVGVQQDSFGNEYGDSWYTQLFVCVYCMSVWVAVVALVVWLLFPTFALLASLPLALSAVSIILTECVDSGRGNRQ